MAHKIEWWVEYEIIAAITIPNEIPALPVEFISPPSSRINLPE